MSAAAGAGRRFARFSRRPAPERNVGGECKVRKHLMRLGKPLAVAAVLLAVAVSYPLRTFAADDTDVLVDFYNGMIDDGQADLTGNSGIIGSQNDEAALSGDFSADFLIVPTPNSDEKQKLTSSWFKDISEDQLIYSPNTGSSYVLFSRMSFYNMAPGDSQGVGVSVKNTDTVNSTLYLWANGAETQQIDDIMNLVMADKNKDFYDKNIKYCNESCLAAGHYVEGGICENLYKPLIDQLVIHITTNDPAIGAVDTHINSGSPVIFKNLKPGQQLDISISVELPGRTSCNAFMYKAAQLQLTFDLTGKNPEYINDNKWYGPGGYGGYTESWPETGLNGGATPTLGPTATPAPVPTLGPTPAPTEIPGEEIPGGNPTQPPKDNSGQNVPVMPPTGEAPLYYNLLAGICIAGLGVWIVAARKNSGKKAK